MQWKLPVKRPLFLQPRTTETPYQDASLCSPTQRKLPVNKSASLCSPPAQRKLLINKAASLCSPGLGLPPGSGSSWSRREAGAPGPGEPASLCSPAQRNPLSSCLYLQSRAAKALQASRSLHGTQKPYSKPLFAKPRGKPLSGLLLQLHTSSSSSESSGMLLAALHRSRHQLPCVKPVKATAAAESTLIGRED